MPLNNATINYINIQTTSNKFKSTKIKYCKETNDNDN